MGDGSGGEKGNFLAVAAEKKQQCPIHQFSFAHLSSSSLSFSPHGVTAKKHQGVLSERRGE